MFSTVSIYPIIHDIFLFSLTSESKRALIYSTKMVVSRTIKTLCSKALSEAMDVRTMYHVVRRIIPDYDIYKRTGFPESFAIPNRDAADAIISDIIKEDLF